LPFSSGITRCNALRRHRSKWESSKPPLHAHDANPCEANRAASGRSCRSESWSSWPHHDAKIIPESPSPPAPGNLWCTKHSIPRGASTGHTPCRSRPSTIVKSGSVAGAEDNHLLHRPVDVLASFRARSEKDRWTRRRYPRPPKPSQGPRDPSRRNTLKLLPFYGRSYRQCASTLFGRLPRMESYFSR